jgi:chromosome segregation ATPase
LAQQNANDKVKEIPELLSRISELQKDADEIRKSRTQLEEKELETSTKLANSQQEVERLKRELVKKREIEGSLSDLEKERNSLFDINEELTRNWKDLQDGNKKLSDMIEELKLSDTQKANDFESLQKKLEGSLNQTQTVTKDKAKLGALMKELEEKLSESLQQNAALLDKSNELQTELSQTKDYISVLNTENASLKDKLNTSVVAGEELDSLAEAVEIWKNRFKELADCLQKQPTIAIVEEKDTTRPRRNSTKAESMVFSAEHKLLQERVGILERLLEQQKQATEENDLHVAQLVKEKDQWLMAWEEVVEEKNLLTEEISRLKVMYSSQISIGVDQGHTKCAHCESSEHPTDECPVAEETF